MSAARRGRSLRRPQGASRRRRLGISTKFADTFGRVERRFVLHFQGVAARFNVVYVPHFPCGCQVDKSSEKKDAQKRKNELQKPENADTIAGLDQ